MNSKNSNADDYRSYQLLDEISRNEEQTQRDLSKKLGLALGLINSYIKNLASKGYITVSTIPKNRFKYYLTPHGFAEKTRLAYQHLQNFTNLYRVARKDFRVLFNELKQLNVEKVAFCGVDEITEIAYLSLEEAGLELAGVVDNAAAGSKFFGFNVLSLEDVKKIDCKIIIITSFSSDIKLRDGLIEHGVKREKIYSVNREGWLKRIEGENHD